MTWSYIGFFILNTRLPSTKSLAKKVRDIHAARIAIWSLLADCIIAFTQNSSPLVMFLLSLVNTCTTCTLYSYLSGFLITSYLGLEFCHWRSSWWHVGFACPGKFIYGEHIQICDSPTYIFFLGGGCCESAAVSCCTEIQMWRLWSSTYILLAEFKNAKKWSANWLKKSVSLLKK